MKKLEREELHLLKKMERIKEQCWQLPLETGKRNGESARKEQQKR